MQIDPPPTWMWALVVALALFVLTHTAYGRVPDGNLPGGYAGRPPTSVHWPGKCWCKYHGPRGGCMQWHCPRKR